MAIYGHHDRHPVTILRLATLDDVIRLEGRPPDPRDVQAVQDGMYVVAAHRDGDSQVYHRGGLRADGAAREIDQAIAALAAPRSLTREDFDTAQPGTAVELRVLRSNGGHAWVAARIAGRSRGRSRIHVDVTRADGSVMSYALSWSECAGLLRHADADRPRASQDTSTPVQGQDPKPYPAPAPARSPTLVDPRDAARLSTRVVEDDDPSLRQSVHVHLGIMLVVDHDGGFRAVFLPSGPVSASGSTERVAIGRLATQLRRIADSLPPSDVPIPGGDS